MITPLLRASRISLSRDRVAQIMIFVMPIAFFSIFAMVFGRQSMSDMSPIRVAVVDEDHSKSSQALVQALKLETALRVSDSVGTASRSGSTARGGSRGAGSLAKPLDRERARAMVRGGDAPVAVVIPAGWGATFPNLVGKGMPVEVFADPAEQVSKQIFTGLLQRSAARVIRNGMNAWLSTAQGGQDELGGTTAPDSSKATGAAAGQSGGAGLDAPDPLSLVPSHMTDVVGDHGADGARMISFYAAGIAVMFLLFSCSAGGGVLLDELESGTLERVLNTRAGMRGLLTAKWLHLTLLGILQITVMFTWGAMVFGLDLLGHLPGFAVMTLATAAAAAAFGLLLASLCRTRQQLGGISTLVILVMSALGGSMFPRFLMSAGMQRVGLATFNAWALDGYIKVFWRELPIIQLWPQVLVLTALTAVFLTTARGMARRWERA